MEEKNDASCRKETVDSLSRPRLKLSVQALCLETERNEEVAATETLECFVGAFVGCDTRELPPGAWDVWIFNMPPFFLHWAPQNSSLPRSLAGSAEVSLRPSNNQNRFVPEKPRTGKRNPEPAGEEESGFHKTHCNSTGFCNPKGLNEHGANIYMLLCNTPWVLCWERKWDVHFF